MNIYYHHHHHHIEECRNGQNLEIQKKKIFFLINIIDQIQGDSVFISRAIAIWPKLTKINSVDYYKTVTNKQTTRTNKQTNGKQSQLIITQRRKKNSFNFIHLKLMVKSIYEIIIILMDSNGFSLTAWFFFWCNQLHNNDFQFPMMCHIRSVSVCVVCQTYWITSSSSFWPKLLVFCFYY